jgi:hypothetical protein
MRSIDLTIVAGSQAVTAFKAIKRFDPSAMLGPTLALLRSAQPLPIDLANCHDLLACFSSLLQLLDELDELRIPYRIEISDRVQSVNEGAPVWVPRPGSKADVVESLEIERKRKLDRDAAAEWRKSYQPPELPIRRTLHSEMLHERWQRLEVEALLPEERDLILLWELHVEVSNGTFDQYLCNSSGDHALEAVDTLRRIGLKTVLDILLQVLDALPGGWCPEREERNRRVASVPDRFEVFRTLTDAYHEAIETEAENSRLMDNLERAYVRERLLAEQTDSSAGRV